MYTIQNKIFSKKINQTNNVICKIKIVVVQLDPISLTRNNYIEGDQLYKITDPIYFRNMKSEEERNRERKITIDNHCQRQHLAASATN